MDGYEQASQQPLGDNILAQIASTAREIIEAQDLVLRREEELKEAQAALRALREDIMPELMSVAGQEELTTADGLKVSIKDMVRGQPSQEKAREAYAWLRESGNGGIVKSQIEADLGKGDAELVKRAVDALSAVGVKSTTKESVQWQTLGALVREMLSKGKNVPLDLLGVRLWKQAEVKPKK